MSSPIGYPEQFGAILQQPKLLEHKQAAPAPDAVSPVPGAEKSDKLLGPSFQQQLAEFVGGVDSMQKKGSHIAEEFAVGHQNDIHGTMIAVEQSEISLHLLANVRNRVVDLYREVMRMGS